jgi:Na+-transporting methylmalonyl-CoA/oxaloacetate decarboxylase gamma subunit
MDNWSFGLTMTVVGMGGTFITLGIIVGFMHLLRKLFPIPDAHGAAGKPRKEVHPK